jgi:hypothetical protein
VVSIWTSVFLAVGLLLHRALLLRLPPPARGWCRGFDGRPLFPIGGSVAAPSASSVWHRWGWKPPLSSTTLTVGLSRSASKVLRGPILKLATSSSKVTSLVRPFQRLATVFSVGSKASGFIPAFILEGGCPDLWLDGGNRGGPDWSVRSFSEVFSTIIRDLCVILFLMGSFVLFCTATAYS